MLTIPDDIKQLYNRRNVPAEVELIIDDTTYTARNLVAGSLSIIESLCSLETFELSSVEKNSLEFSLFNETQSIKNLVNKTVVATHVLTKDDGTVYNVPLGTYTIVEAVNTSDSIIKCTCYDGMLKFDKIVDDWWNTTVTFPITIKNLATALFDYLNINYDIPNTFTNSDFVVTARPNFFENVTAAELLGWIQEIACGFFKVNRYGVLKFLGGEYLSPLYPSLTLYPSEALFPSTGAFRFGNSVGSVDYNGPKIYGQLEIADFVTKEIERVQLRGTEDDVGVIVGSGTNTYVIQSNPLLYNITDTTGRPVAQAIYDILSNFTYKPFTGNFQSTPYIEVGDVVNVVSYKGHTASSPIFYRELHAQKLHADTFTSKGTEYRQTTTTFNKLLRTLNQKTHELVVDVETLSSTITNVQTTLERNYSTTTQMQSAIQQSANSILTTVSTTYETKEDATSKESTLNGKINEKAKVYSGTTQPATANTGDLWIDTSLTSGNVPKNVIYRYDGTQWVISQDAQIVTNKSSIEQQANKIALVVKTENNQNVVNTAEIVAGINGQSGSFTKIKADTINLDGYVTISNLKTSGTVEINGGNIKGGTITLGGNNNGNGQIIVKDSSNNTIGTWNNAGITLQNNGSIIGGDMWWYKGTNNQARLYASSVSYGSTYYGVRLSAKAVELATSGGIVYLHANSSNEHAEIYATPSIAVMSYKNGASFSVKPYSGALSGAPYVNAPENGSASTYHNWAIAWKLISGKWVLGLYNPEDPEEIEEM